MRFLSRFGGVAHSTMGVSRPRSCARLACARGVGSKPLILLFCITVGTSLFRGTERPRSLASPFLSPACHRVPHHSDVLCCFCLVASILFLFISRADLSLDLNGVPDLIVTLMLFVFALVSRKAEKLAVEAIDTAQQTPQDYTGTTVACHG